jgi:RNA polymerase sigma-70 factor (ECF subfamily)
MAAHLSPEFKVEVSDHYAEIDELYERYAQEAPNYGVTREDFRAAVRAGVDKYLINATQAVSLAPSADEVRAFIADLQAADLYLALACANGNEHAWWEFDQTHRRYIERIARHLASAETDAEEVIDSVYVELYGTRVVDGVRQSKFTTYTGRGTLRGWLRTIVWHAVIDIHRARRDEISLDDWTEAGGEAHKRPGWRGAKAAAARGGEETMIEGVTRERYRAAVVAALDAAFASLDDHEKLLLLFYHVENLKLREIARLVETPASPLRRWFQRQSKRRVSIPESRVHESTVMRWLEKVYGKVLTRFRDELEKKNRLQPEEIALCVEMASADLAAEDVRRHLVKVKSETLSKDAGQTPSTFREE